METNGSLQIRTFYNNPKYCASASFVHFFVFLVKYFWIGVMYLSHAHKRACIGYAISFGVCMRTYVGVPKVLNLANYESDLLHNCTDGFTVPVL